MDAFVQANGRLQLVLKSDVVDDVVVSEWLLDEEKVEPVELLEKREVFKGVGGVGVDLERDVGIAFAHLFNDVDIPTGRDLEFDASIAFVEIL